MISQTEIPTVLNAQHFFMTRLSALWKIDTAEFSKKDRLSIVLSKSSDHCEIQTSAFQIIRYYYQINTQNMGSTKIHHKI